MNWGGFGDPQYVRLCTLHIGSGFGRRSKYRLRKPSARAPRNRMPSPGRFPCARFDAALYRAKPAGRTRRPVPASDPFQNGASRP